MAVFVSGIPVKIPSGILEDLDLRCRLLHNQNSDGKSRKTPEKTTSPIGILSDEQTAVEISKNRFHLKNTR